MVTALSPVVGNCDVPGCGWLRPRGWMRPMAMMARSPTMKTIVGSRKAVAVSPRPRRLSSMMNTRIPRHSGMVAPSSAGKADCSPATPAAMDTATVSV